MHVQARDVDPLRHAGERHARAPQFREAATNHRDVAAIHAVQPARNVAQLRFPILQVDEARGQAWRVPGHMLKVDS